MEERELMVEIPLEKYEDLLDIESRVNAAAELVCNSRIVDNETLYRVIGHPGMVCIADKIKKERIECLERIKEESNGD